MRVGSRHVFQVAVPSQKGPFAGSSAQPVERLPFAKLFAPDDFRASLRSVFL